MKTKIEITATHPAFGEVTFVIRADDGKQAFTLWKQIVYSSRQWVVQKNSGSNVPQTAKVTSCENTARPVARLAAGRFEDESADLNEILDL